MADVFISYHEKSAGELVAHIVDVLENSGISCWYAKRDMEPGGNFASYIKQEICSCKIFLLVLNEASNHSQHVKNEINIAFQRINDEKSLTLLPFKVDDCTLSDDLEYYLGRIHIMNGVPPDTKHIQTLVAHIHHILGEISLKVDDKTVNDLTRKLKRLTILSVLSWLTALAGLAIALMPLPSRQDNQWNGHTYRLFDNSCNWEEAQRRCEILGGHLVTITSSEEQGFIEKNILPAGEKSVYWIGASDAEKEGVWKWVTDEPWLEENANWDKRNGEPNNKSAFTEESENYASICADSSKYGYWNDLRKDGDSAKPKTGYNLANIGYICEWEPGAYFYTEQQYSGFEVFSEKIWNLTQKIRASKPNDESG